MNPSPATAIANLVYRYAELIDEGDFAGVARLFEDGCVVGPDGGESRGFEAVLDLYRGAARIYPESGTPCTQHVTTNLIIEIDEAGHSAQARSVFTVYQALEDFPLQVIITGSYRDEFALVDGAWGFRRRQILPRLVGDMSRHLLGAVDTLTGEGKTQ